MKKLTTILLAMLLLASSACAESLTAELGLTRDAKPANTLCGVLPAGFH